MYRHDLFYPTAPFVPPTGGSQKNPHGFPILLNFPAWRPIVVSAQEQFAQFLASNGTTRIAPTPAIYWESPVSLPISPALSYIH
jgi:hypothetical protein